MKNQAARKLSFEEYTIENGGRLSQFETENKCVSYSQDRKIV